MIKCQKANGVKLISGTQSGRTAREFTHYIANAIREKLAIIMCSANAFSVLSDGSQARKTGKEKELILIRLVRSGVPVYYCVSLEDMDEYGDANADNLKLCIDHTFNDNLQIPGNKYCKMMVSATSDGASVNTGKYNGLLVQLERSDRPWLVKIHCVSHRLELGLKDSLLKEKSFSDIKDLMVTIYYLFRNSGKLKTQFHKLGNVLGVTIYTFPKVHGTRFINHQRRGLHHLLNNWGILMQLFENCISSTDRGYNNIKAKLRGVLKKLKNFSFLSRCAFYLQLLENISKFSLKLEEGSIHVFEVPLLLDTTTSANEDLMNHDFSDFLQESNIFIHKDDDDKVTQVVWKLSKAGHNRKLLQNREYAEVVVSRSQLSNVDDAGAHVSHVMNLIIQQVNTCLSGRFRSFVEQDSLFSNMIWMDPANWTDTETELNMMDKLATHFSVPLQFAGFMQSCLKKEWPKLKKVVQFFYKGFKARKLWEKIFIYRRNDFANVCLLVEIIMCLGPSNSMVEKGFSQLTSMLSDRRLCLNADTMQDLLLFQVNHSSWTPAERDEIIESALNKYLIKRRKMKIDSKPFNLLGVSGTRKRKHSDTESQGDLDSDDLSDSVSVEDQDDAPVYVVKNTDGVDQEGSEFEYHIDSDDDDLLGDVAPSDDEEDVTWERLESSMALGLVEGEALNEDIVDE